jgi:hypothetical protein
MSQTFASSAAVAERLRPFATPEKLEKVAAEAQAIKVSVYAGHERPAKRIGFPDAFPNMASLRDAVEAASPPALEVVTRLLPAIGGDAPEAAFDLLERSLWPEIEDAALEAIASLQTARAFRRLLEVGSPRALTLLSGRRFEGALPLVEELLTASKTLNLAPFAHPTRRALAGLSEADRKAHKEKRQAATAGLDPAARVRDQALLMNLAHAGPSRLRPLVFRTLREHPHADVRRTAANVLLQWGDDEALDALIALEDDPDLSGPAFTAMFRKDPRAPYDRVVAVAEPNNADIARLLETVARDQDPKLVKVSRGLVQADPRWLDLALAKKNDRDRELKQAALQLIELSPKDLVAARTKKG